MTFEELMQQIEELNPQTRQNIKSVIDLTTLGQKVKPEFRTHLENASTYVEFLDAIYDDDEQRFSLAWGKWAKLDKKEWLDRFDAEKIIRDIKVQRIGLEVHFNSGSVFVPTGSFLKSTSVYVFKDGGFNEAPADLITTLSGDFECAEIKFTGVYGVYTYRGKIILGEWVVDSDGRRRKQLHVPKGFTFRC